MPKILIYSAAVLAVCLALPVADAQAGPAGRVAVLESAGAPIAPGATWAWAPMTTSSPDPRVANDILQERLHVAVETNLAAKGLSRAAHSDARYLVTYHVAIDDKVEAKVDSHDYPVSACGIRGCIRGWASYGPATVRMSDYQEGTLVLSVIDRQSGQLVWRAASKKRVSKKDASQANLNAVVADMTRSLPTKRA
jgi:hypothetical protein